MGFNTTIVVCNDALGSIERDPHFGRSLSIGISELFGARREGRTTVDIPSGGHCNAAMVVETHHADNTALITVGGNLGIKHLETYGWSHHEPGMQARLLAEWADRLGFKLVAKTKKDKR